jgi:copper oxidase (laccase) domain-containing protein
MKDENIETHPGCTVRDEQFYSYRREKDHSGRMMAVIQMCKTEV